MVNIVKYILQPTRLQLLNEILWPTKSQTKIHPVHGSWIFTPLSPNSQSWATVGKEGQPQPQGSFLSPERSSSEIPRQTQSDKVKDLLSQEHLHLKCPLTGQKNNLFSP